MKIIFLLFDSLRLCFSHKTPTSSVSINGDTYTDLYQDNRAANEYEGFLGFYDWLINSKSEVIGVYLTLTDFSENLIPYILKYENVVVDDDGLGVYIYFSGDRDYLENLSNSQTFGCNKLYETKEGKVAMSFGSPPEGVKSVLGVRL